MLGGRGSWEPLGDPAAAYAAGKLKFRLHGERLRGGWTLVRRRGRAQDKQGLWLLIKEADEAASTDVGVARAEDERSVLSGRTMGEIAAAPERVWRSNRGETPLASPPRKVGRKGSLAFVPPQLATLAAEAPAGQEWLHELKHDGYRVQLRLQDGGAALLTRNGHDWTHRFRGLPQAARDLQADMALIDGEIVVLDENGVSSFARLKAALGEGVPELLYVHQIARRHAVLPWS